MGREDLRRFGEKSMQNRNTYGGMDEREEIGGEGGMAQQLEQILASGLPPLYRRAYRDTFTGLLTNPAGNRCQYPSGWRITGRIPKMNP